MQKDNIFSTWWSRMLEYGCWHTEELTFPQIVQTSDLTLSSGPTLPSTWWWHSLQSHRRQDAKRFTKGRVQSTATDTIPTSDPLPKECTRIKGSKHLLMGGSWLLMLVAVVIALYFTHKNKKLLQTRLKHLLLHKCFQQGIQQTANSDNKLYNQYLPAH